MKTKPETRPSAVGAVLPYFGSKRTLAGTIVEELGPHDTYGEPCAGSLAIILRKPVARTELANDLNGDVTCLAWTLQDDHLAPRLYDRITRTLFNEATHRAALAYLATHHAPDRADLEFSFHYLVASWMGRNGTAGQANPPSGFCVRWTASGGDGAKRWASVGESIPDWHERLKRVTILRRDLFDLLPSMADAPGAVLYVDPPYLVKGSKYKCDFTPADHERLAAELARFKSTRVVVSYYLDPQLADLYDGWTLRPLTATKNMANSVGKSSAGRVAAPEVLLINGPSLGLPSAGKLLGRPTSPKTIFFGA